MTNLGKGLQSLIPPKQRSAEVDYPKTSQPLRDRKESVFDIEVGKIKDNPYYIKVTVNNKTVSVLISQIRAFSAKRIEDKLAEIDTNDFRKVKEDVVKMISFSLSPKRESRG